MMDMLDRRGTLAVESGAWNEAGTRNRFARVAFLALMCLATSGLFGVLCLQAHAPSACAVGIADTTSALCLAFAADNMKLAALFSGGVVPSQSSCSDIDSTGTITPNPCPADTDFRVGVEAYRSSDGAALRINAAAYYFLPATVSAYRLWRAGYTTQKPSPDVYTVNRLLPPAIGGVDISGFRMTTPGKFELIVEMSVHAHDNSTSFVCTSGDSRFIEITGIPDTTPPTVTIDQAATQADPTNANPVNFTVVFSEAIDPQSFSSADVLLAGTAGGKMSVVLTKMNDTRWNVAVLGITTGGTVTASIPAGAVADPSGNTNVDSSTSTDNTVTLQTPIEAAVPDVTGQLQLDADNALIAAAMTTGTVTRQCSNTVAAGLVSGQDPAAGTMAPLGAVVALVISTGFCNETVPGVLGQTQTDATATITSAGFAVGMITEECSNNVAAGKVLSQSPVPGQQALFGDAITLVLSTGPCNVNVPNVLGQTLAGAGASLTGAGLAVGAVTQECSNTVAAGAVLRQSLAADTQAPFGSTVDLVLSTGPCNMAVPDTVGKTQMAAGAAITAAGLSAGTNTQECSNTVAAGKVLRQNPAAGQQVPFGSAVTLVLSTGQCDVTVPNLLGLSEATADSTLTAVNLVVGTVARQCSDTAAKNTITGQTPVAGAQAAYGSAVALVVSSGPCDITVPNVVGLSQTAAAATLEGAYLATATATQQCSDTVPDGVVISQTPESGQHAASGTEVALVVSSGACTRTVPNLAGMAELTARMTISGAHLTVGTVAAQCGNSAGTGAVIGQNPAAGTSLPIGGRVDLIMSTGPCEGVEPTDAQLQNALLSGFQSMDGDGDGQISYFEALLALPDLSVITFNHVDSNGDGRISRDEAGLDQESDGCTGFAGGKGAFTVEKLKSVFGSLFFAGPGPGILVHLSRK